jgi:alkanesulfonate monooxygenase SsuD/methylene tetrahydromethanopterin reductase-like flavin-dependent oxidoreductase (luciferase family)
MTERDVFLSVGAQPSLDAIVEQVVRAEELGYDTVWTPESWGRDAVTVLATAAERTVEVGLGTSILNVYRGCLPQERPTVQYQIPNVNRSISRVPGPRPTAIIAPSSIIAKRGLSSMNSSLNSATIASGIASLISANGQASPT